MSEFGEFEWGTEPLGGVLPTGVAQPTCADVLRLLFPVPLGGVFDGDIEVEGKSLDRGQASAEGLLRDMFPDTASVILDMTVADCYFNGASATVSAGISLTNPQNQNATLRNLHFNGMTGNPPPYTLTALNTSIGISGGKANGVGSTGTLTLAGAASTTVTNYNVTVNSKVKLTPTNAAAATLIHGTSSPYHDPISNVSGTSFTIRTADGGSAAGTETFEYEIID